MWKVSGARNERTVLIKQCEQSKRTIRLQGHRDMKKESRKRFFHTKLDKSLDGKKGWRAEEKSSSNLVGNDSWPRESKERN